MTQPIVTLFVIVCSMAACSPRSPGVESLASTSLDIYFEPDPAPESTHNRVRLVKRSSDPGQLSFDIRADQIPSLYGGSVALSFDPELVAIDEVTAGDLTDEGILATSTDSQSRPGEQTIGFVVEPDLTDGVIATVTVNATGLGTGRLAFVRADELPSRASQLINAHGVGMGGIRWVGGAFRVSEVAQ